MKSGEFVEYLVGLSAPEQDRGILAALRRGLSGEARDLARVYPIVLKHAPSKDPNDAYIWTACLYGSHPTKPDQRGRAVSLARAMRAVADETRSESVEARFVALLRCHKDELLEHLRHCVSLARSKEIPLEWTDVLRALRWWDQDDGVHVTAQRLWAKQFWGYDPPVPEGAKASASEASSS